jgi:hypothetical protein
MKQNIKLLFGSILLLSSLLITSCTKVIDVDLNSQDPKFVIEGFVTLGETTHRISITKTLNIDESSEYPTVNNATVLLSDDLGNSQNMVLVGPGIYEATGFTVAEGRTYTLTVSVDSEVFIASEKMSETVILDTLQTFPFSFGPTTVNAIVPVRTDPAGIKNFYQFHLIDNDTLKSGIYIQSDQYNDGNVMMEPIFAEGIDSGDTVNVEMFGISEVVYDYFFTLLQNDQGATPANPSSNFSGGALGYFSVRTKQSKEIIIP